MKKKRLVKDKNAQFYLIAAIIIVAIIITLSTATNYIITKKTPVRFYDLSGELGEEGARVVDHGIYKAEDIPGKIETFLNDFISYSEEKDIEQFIFIYGNENEAKVKNYKSEGTGDITIIYGGTTFTFSDTKMLVPTSTTGEIGEITVLLDKNYKLKLKEGENFLFIISKKEGEERYVTGSPAVTVPEEPPVCEIVKDPAEEDVTINENRKVYTRLMNGDGYLILKGYIDDNIFGYITRAEDGTKVSIISFDIASDSYELNYINNHIGNINNLGGIICGFNDNVCIVNRNGKIILKTEWTINDNNEKTLDGLSFKTCPDIICSGPNRDASYCDTKNTPGTTSEERCASYTNNQLRIDLVAGDTINIYSIPDEYNWLTNPNPDWGLVHIEVWERAATC